MELSAGSGAWNIFCLRVLQVDPVQPGLHVHIPAFSHSEVHIAKEKHNGAISAG